MNSPLTQRLGNPRSDRLWVQSNHVEPDAQGVGAGTGPAARAERSGGSPEIGRRPVGSRASTVRVDIGPFASRAGDSVALEPSGRRRRAALRGRVRGAARPI